VNMPLIQKKETAIQEIKSKLATEVNELERGAFGGLAARAEALSRLAAQSEAIHWASFFVMLLFIAVETAPIFVKLISPRSPYDHLLAEHEQQYELSAKEVMTVRKNDVFNRLREHAEVGVHQTKSDIKHKKAVIDAELQHKLDELRSGGYLLD